MMMMTLLMAEREMELEGDGEDGDGDGSGNVSRSVALHKASSRSSSKQILVGGRTSVPAAVDEGHEKRTKGAEKQARQDDDNDDDDGDNGNGNGSTTHHQAMKHQREHCE